MTHYHIEVQDEAQGPWRNWFAGGRPSEAHKDSNGAVVLGTLASMPVITDHAEATLVRNFVDRHFRVYALRIRAAQSVGVAA
jgi:hypothetical protein